MKKQNGISLIVLIVTIIVVIILAAVVILTLSKNNPIESAKEASFKEDVRTFQDELAMYISKDYTSKSGQRDEKITETDSSKIKDYIPSFSKKYEGKFVIKNDELMYSEGKLTQEEQAWSGSLNVKLNQKTGAEKAKENPQNYYGAKVKYTAPNGVNDWKIFYSDGSNVYIITSEYVDPDNLPEKDGVKPVKLDNINDSKDANFNNNLLSKYSGSTSITDNKMKAFNSDYFEKKYSSAGANMKAVAYMLDKEIWSELYANTLVAEYAVGGPSIEMILKSYSEKKNVDYRAMAVSEVGYQISKDGGANWINSNSTMFDRKASLYVLTSSSGASSMWLASPSAERDYCLLVVGENYGSVGSNWTGNPYSGFRPLVCLNSNVLLKWNEQDQIYEIK